MSNLSFLRNFNPESYKESIEDKECYISCRPELSKYVGEEKLKKIEEYLPNRKVLSKLCKLKLLKYANIAINIIDIDAKDASYQFFYTIRSFDNEIFIPDYKKIRNEIFQALGYHILISSEIDKHFQALCVSLEKEPLLFESNMKFIKKYITSKTFRESSAPYKEHFLKFLDEENAERIFSVCIDLGLSLEDINKLAEFYIQNSITYSSDIYTAKYLTMILKNCSTEDLQKIYGYKRAWNKIPCYCHFLSRDTFLFDKASSLILFFMTLHPYSIFGFNVIEYFINTESLDRVALNKTPRMYAELMNKYSAN